MGTIGYGDKCGIGRVAAFHKFFDNFSSLIGKKVLIVNTASDCGFTGQYEALEKLQEKYAESLVVIGFPANDFKGQETKDNETIAAFCKKIME